MFFTCESPCCRFSWLWRSWVAAASVRERPREEPGLGSQPQRGEPPRFEEKEQDDEQAEEDVVELTDREPPGVGGARRDQRIEDHEVGVLRDEALPAHHEQGAEHRAEHRADAARSEEHTSELQSLMRTSYAVFCLKNKRKT